MDRGIEIEMMKTMAIKFNFTINYQNFERSTWSDLYGNITAKQIDFGMGGTVMTADRLEKVGYLYPHFIDKFTFATSPSVANTNQFDLNILIRPMDSTVWLLLAATLIILLFVGRLFQSIQPVNDERIPHDLFEICMHHLLRQTVPYLRLTNRPTKICSMFWAFTAVITLSNNYTGSLSSILALPSQYSMDTIIELAKQCRNDHYITLGIVNSTAYTSLKQSTVEEIHLIGHRMQYISNNDEAISMIIRQSERQQRRTSFSSNNNHPSYVFISSRLRLIFEQINVGQNLIFIPPDTQESQLYPLYVAIAITKSFLYRKQFDQMISYFHSSGMFIHWMNMEIIHAILSRKFPNNQPDVDENIDQQQQQQQQQRKERKLLKMNIFNTYVRMNNHLTFYDLKSIFILYIISITITFIILLMEFISSLSFDKMIVCHLYYR
ncbi:hypothetical protein BLA29_002980 [Euroglyphus maynei]|uniref:Uncharacterized protein n=1 Tax=Euroglyphus maynei TaxID=6958 RepID=A0A1Y3AXZ2_EURMA|nr:hypothetical protein BLA29_002980 [Euroglyphus maynei]